MFLIYNLKKTQNFQTMPHCVEASCREQKCSCNLLMLSHKLISNLAHEHTVISTGTQSDIFHQTPQLSLNGRLVLQQDVF